MSQEANLRLCVSFTADIYCQCLECVPAFSPTLDPLKVVCGLMIKCKRIAIYLFFPLGVVPPSDVAIFLDL